MSNETITHRLVMLHVDFLNRPGIRRITRKYPRGVEWILHLVFTARECLLTGKILIGGKPITPTDLDVVFYNPAENMDTFLQDLVTEGFLTLDSGVYQIEKWSEWHKPKSKTPGYEPEGGGSPRKTPETPGSAEQGAEAATPQPQPQPPTSSASATPTDSTSTTAADSDSEPSESDGVLSAETWARAWGIIKPVLVGFGSVRGPVEQAYRATVGRFACWEEPAHSGKRLTFDQIEAACRELKRAYAAKKAVDPPEKPHFWARAVFGDLFQQAYYHDQHLGLPLKDFRWKAPDDPRDLVTK